MKILELLEKYEYEFKDKNGVTFKKPLKYLYFNNKRFMDIVDVLQVKFNEENVLMVIAILIENIQNLERQNKNLLENGQMITLDLNSKNDRLIKELIGGYKIGK